MSELLIQISAFTIFISILIQIGFNLFLSKKYSSYTLDNGQVVEPPIPEYIKTIQLVLYIITILGIAGLITGICIQ